VTITGGTALSQDDIDRMVGDAEKHANEDQERKEHAEARNQADHLAYQTEKQIAELGDKVGDDVKQPVEEQITKVRKLLAEDASTEDLKAATNELMTGAQSIGQMIYEQAAADAQAAEAGEAAAEGDDVVEAEIIDEEGDGAE
jgi:molecular chaperone DnaK